MINTLIDTCSFLDLLQKEQSLDFINGILTLQKEGKINILLPQIVIEEWDKNKIIAKNRLEDNFKTKTKHFKEVALSSNLHIGVNPMKSKIDEIDLKIDAIDQIILNCHLIQVTKKVKALIPDRSILVNGKRKAPFHNKLDSVKDAYIIFSVLEYLFEKSINNLLFISSNKNDFGDPNSTEIRLHQDISKDYPLIKIDYFNDIFWAFKKYRNELPIDVETTSNLKDLSIHTQIEIDTKLPIREQLYIYLSERFKDINILPSELFIQNYPFQGYNNVSYSIRNNFTLRLGYKELESVFKDIKVTESELVNEFNNQEDYNQIKFILGTLSQNHIFYINGNELFKDIRITNWKEDSGHVDSLEKLCFVEAYSQSPKVKSSNTIWNNLEIAYFYYTTGDILKSYKCYSKVLSYIQEDNREIISVICHFNLFHLSRLLKFRYEPSIFRDNSIEQKSYREIRNLRVSPVNEDIQYYITSNNFFSIPKENILDLKKKVTDTYHSFIRGGWSSSTFEYDILYNYATLHSFLKKNCLVYDEYSDYRKLVTELIDSYLLSFSIKNGRDSISSFDDYLIYHIVTYAETKEFNKLIFRYSIHEIGYEKTGKNGEDFMSLYTNYISTNYLKLNEVLSQKDQEVIERFWDKHPRYFNNLNLLASLLSLSKTENQLIAKKIIKYVENNYELITRNYDAVYYIFAFFTRKFEKLNLIYLKKFISLVLCKDQFFKENFFEGFIDEFKHFKRLINFEDSFFNKSILPRIEKQLNLVGASNRVDCLYYFYIILNDNQKSKVLKKYLKSLDNSFNYNHYCSLVVYEVIDIYYKKYFDYFVLGIDLSLERPIEKRNFKYEMYPIIDRLLNICFKNGVNLQDEKFDKLKGINHYYDWLLDINEYDYTVFDPYWVGVYGTKYYNSYFKSSNHLKYIMSDIVQKAQDERLNVLYEKIYLHSK